MKFLKYLNKLDNEPALSAAKLTLVESSESTKVLLSSIDDSEAITKINKLLKNLNSSLDFVYAGKKFKVGLDITTNDNLDKISLSETKKASLKEKWLVISSELAKIQLDL